MIHTSHSLEDTRKIAALFVDYLSSSPSNVFGFSGDLGSGKTTFTQCVAELLGVSGYVTSPTFVIEKIYPIDFAGFKKLVHIDAYRIENAAELDVLGWEYAVSDKSNLILVEWPERVLESMPPEAPILRFSFVSEHVRTIEFPAMMGK